MKREEEDSIPFPLHLVVFLFPSLQNYKQSCSLPLLNYEESYSSSMQIYEQRVQLFQISAFVMLISFNGGANLRQVRGTDRCVDADIEVLEI